MANLIRLVACLSILLSFNTKALVINGCAIEAWTVCPNADLSNADLSGANLSYAYLIEAILEGVYGRLSNASGIVLPSSYFIFNNYIVGPDVDLSGANLRSANLGPGVNLSGANLNGADMSGVIFNGAFLNRINLNGADLTNINMTDAQLFIVDLINANLTNANLTGGVLNMF